MAAKTPVVVGIDQSYSKIGFAAATRKGLLTAEVVDLSKLDQTQTRLAVKELTKEWIKKHHPSLICVERVRLFAGRYISMVTAKQLSALTAYIVDAAYCFGEYEGGGDYRKTPVPVFSCDTRSWKKEMLGNGNAEKSAALDWLMEELPHNGGIALDHNAADAACMASYAFRKGAKLTRER